jgi:hypothetical protein
LLTAPLTIQFACSSEPLIGGGAPAGSEGEETTPTATPEPFVVAEGTSERLLMAGTPQETPFYVFGSGRPGPVLAVLGGVHGNEPGGWLAAERLVESLRPATGAFLILPRANTLAIVDFVRTTDELGDLNRLYPGDPNGLPMARMAYEITETLREFQASFLIDMHESWAFYRDRTETQGGTAFLGQTMATPGTEPGRSLGQATVDAVNARIQAPWEEMTYRERSRNGSRLGRSGGSSSSSLGLPSVVPGLSVFLVEMGQQQDLERRIALHMDIVGEIAQRIGL